MTDLADTPANQPGAMPIDVISIPSQVVYGRVGNNVAMPWEELALSLPTGAAGVTE